VTREIEVFTMAFCVKGKAMNRLRFVFLLLFTRAGGALGELEERRGTGLRGGPGLRGTPDFFVFSLFKAFFYCVFWDLN
jgi:hypothetical protein